MINILTKLTRSQKNYRGKYFLRKKLLAHNFKSSFTTINLHDDLKIRLNISDFVDKYLWVTGEYEPKLKKFIKDYLKEGDVFLDIGANIGYFSIVASRIVKKEGSVISIEANPSMVDRLITNLELNKANNVQVINKAASNEKGVLEFYIPNINNSGMASLRAQDNSTKINVETIVLDDTLREIKNLDFVKIDIEGAKLIALRGMKSLIIRFNPIIVLELTDEFLKSFNSSSSDLINFLKSLNYCLFSLETGEPIDAKKSYKQINIYCLPRK